MILLSAASAAFATSPNYLVIIADDLGADKVSAYYPDFVGYEAAALHEPHTPVIDGLAADGVRFQNAWANPSCSPTRASIQTGVRPSLHGIGTALDEGSPGLDPAAYTDATGAPDQLLAQLLGGAGYATGYFGKWHVGETDEAGNVPPAAPGKVVLPPHPARLGYGHFFGTVAGMMPDYDHWDSVSWDGVAGSVTAESQHATTVTTDEALAWIGAQQDSWLAVVAYHAPHSPDDDVAPYWEYDDLPVPLRTPLPGDCLAAVPPTCTDEARAVYRGLVEHMDREIFRLLNGVDDAVLEDTVIVFLGDNGTPDDVQEIKVPATRGGKGTAYEGGIHVPLIVADGGAWLGTAGPHDVTSGLVVNAPVHVMDLHATLIDMPGITGVAVTESVSMWDCLTASTADCGRTKQLRYAEKFQAVRDEDKPDVAAVRKGRPDKLVIQVDEDLAGDACLDYEFYDLLLDPLETTPTSLPAVPTARQQALLDYFTTLNPAWASGLGPCP